MLLAEHRKRLVVDTRFDLIGHRVHKVVAVLLRMEAHKIGSQHAFKYLFTPRANTELCRRRPRDVPEHGDLCVGSTFLYERGNECEMIVLYEYDRSLHVPYFTQQSLGE